MDRWVWSLVLLGALGCFLLGVMMREVRLLEEVRDGGLVRAMGVKVVCRIGGGG